MGNGLAEMRAELRMQGLVEMGEAEGISDEVEKLSAKEGWVEGREVGSWVEQVVVG